MNRTAFSLAVAACLAAGGLWGCSSQSAQDQAAQAVRDLETQTMTDANAHDIDKFASHFAGDAVMSGADGSMVSGADAIKRTMSPLISDPTTSTSFPIDRIVVAKSADLAYAYGTYTISQAASTSHKATQTQGGWIDVLRKGDDGQWRFAATVTSVKPPGG